MPESSYERARKFSMPLHADPELAVHEAIKNANENASNDEFSIGHHQIARNAFEALGGFDSATGNPDTIHTLLRTGVDMGHYSPAHVMNLAEQYGVNNSNARDAISLYGELHRLAKINNR
jgi:hypothetical protein